MRTFADTSGRVDLGFAQYATLGAGLILLAGATLYLARLAKRALPKTPEPPG